MAGKQEGLNQDTSVGPSGQPAPDASIERDSDTGSEGQDSRTITKTWSLWDPPFDMSCLYRSNS